MAGTEVLARGLGWFSIGLGLTEVLATETLTHTLGITGQESLVRAFGMREIGAGLGILTSAGPAPGWVWARVAGDALDLAVLASAFTPSNPKRENVGVALATVAGVTALDILCAEQLSAGKGGTKAAVPLPALPTGTGSTTSETADQAGAPPDAHELKHSITINKPATDLQAMWRDPSVQAQIKGHFAQTDAQGNMGDETHWTVQGPLGKTYRWSEHIVEEKPGELTRFESLPGGDLRNEGSLHFRPAPGDWGTEVTLHFKFEPPGGLLGKAAAHFTSVIPDTLANDVLRRFKALVETGEIPTLKQNVSGRGVGDTA